MNHLPSHPTDADPTFTVLGGIVLWPCPGGLTGGRLVICFPQSSRVVLSMHPGLKKVLRDSHLVLPQTPWGDMGQAQTAPLLLDLARLL